MDSFEEWVKNQTHPCLQTWAERLLELGVSWDSFRRDSQEVVQDLVDGGIPLLAARDVVNIASETLKSNQAPMAIFWDLENLAIPSSSSGRDVATRLKQILAPHGKLKQFCGYASIGEGHIPQQKRSDLQLSGCMLVDCPHVGRKEVVDKTIIVDVMQFAYEHPEGATLCLITGDVDYAYLLAVLQKKPQWRTIVISKGTIRSMLHVNCDMKMRWETDILEMRVAAPALCAWSTPSTATKSLVSRASLEALTRDEEWDDDLELLRMAIRAAPFSAGGGGSSVLKSYVGGSLRTTNPARFPQRAAVRAFLATVISNKVVTESGEGANKTLSLTAADTHLITMPVSDRLPISINEIPKKALTMTSSLPFCLFEKWYLCPKNEGKQFPDRAFVQSIPGKWAMIMFHTLREVLQGVAAFPWLRSGRLVDWRLLTSGSHELQQPATRPSTPTCSVCKEESSPPESIDGQGLCSVCAVSTTVGWAVDRVIQMLEMMAANDDICVAKNILRTALMFRWPDQCPSKQHAAVWIQEALASDNAIEFDRPQIKVKSWICLKSIKNQAMAPFPSESMDTSREEDHVLDLLWEHKGGWMRRTAVIASLVEHFPATMKTPALRNRVFINAAQNGRFFVAKGPYGQVVALIKSDAHDALELLGDDDGDTVQSEESTMEPRLPTLVD